MNQRVLIPRAVPTDVQSIGIFRSACTWGLVTTELIRFLNGTQKTSPGHKVAPRMIGVISEDYVLINLFKILIPQLLVFVFNHECCDSGRVRWRIVDSFVVRHSIVWYPIGASVLLLSKEAHKWPKVSSSRGEQFAINASYLDNNRLSTILPDSVSLVSLFL